MDYYSYLSALPDEFAVRILYMICHQNQKVRASKTDSAEGNAFNLV